MSDILINFIAHTEQLQPAIDILDEIAAKAGLIGEKWKQIATAMATGNTSAVQSSIKLSGSIDQAVQSEKSLATQAKTTSVALDNQNKSGTESSNKLASSIDSLVTASKSLDKNIIGAAYKQTLKELQAQLGLTNREVISFIQNARKSAQEAIFSASDEKEIKDLTLSIEVMNQQLKELGVSEDNLSGKTLTLRTRLQQAKEEFIALQDKGIIGPQLDAARNKVAQLADQFSDLQTEVRFLGSDTKNLDGLISLASGVAGGFSAAQGAIALFGGENEDLQKALLKVNSAMAIAQGLAQVQNTIQKESAASLLFTSKARKADAIAIEGETVAQEGLNVAMKANPVGLVIVAITALITALSLFESSEEKSAENTKKLNEFLSEQFDLNKDLAGIFPTVNTRLKENLELQLKLLQANDASASSQLNKKKELARTSAEIAQAEVDRLQQENGSLEENAKKLEAVNQRIIASSKAKSAILELERQRSEKGFDITAAESGALNEKTRELELIVLSKTRLEALQAEKSLLTKIVDDQKSAADALKNSFEDTTTLTVEEQRDLYTNGLKSAAAFSEALLANKKLFIVKNQVDSIASIKDVTDAEINAIRARQQEELKSNNNLTPGERAKISAQANLQVAEVQKQSEIEILDIQKKTISDRLAASIKGSKDEFDYKLQLINLEQEEELKAIQLTEDQKSAIILKKQKERDDLEISRRQTLLQDQISLYNAELDQFGITERQKLPIVITRLDAQERIELLGAQNNEKKIAEIKAKYAKERINAERDSIETELQIDLQSLEIYGQRAKSINESILNNPVSSTASKNIANNDLQIQAQEKIDLQKKTNEKLLANLVITNNEFLLRKKDLENQEDEISQIHSSNRIQIFREEQDKKLAILENVVSVMQKGLDLLDTSALKTGLTEVLGLFTKIGTAIANNRAAQKAADLESDPIRKAALQAAADEQKTESAREEKLAAIAALQNTINQLFADAAAKRQQELNERLQALEDQKNVELDNANLTAKQKDDINKRFAAKERQEKIKAFEADKKAKVEQSVINGLLAFTAALPNFVLAGIALASSLVIAGKIASQPTPKFKHGEVNIDTSKWHQSYTGKVNVQGPGTTTSDSIPAYISKGESVISAKATSKWKDVLQAINTDRMDGLLSKHYHNHQFIYPHIPKDVQMPATQKEIDYDKLSNAIAAKMKGIIPSPVQIENNMDADSIKKFLLQGHTKTEIKNKRYSMKP